MALLNLGDDPWLLEHESCEKLQRDIMEQLSQRQSTKLSDKFASLSANIRVRLKQFYNEVTELKRKLNEADNSRSITYDEKERRTRQVELLMSKYIQMQKSFEENSRNYNRDRTQLMGTSVWGTQDEELIDSGPSQESVSDIRRDQQRMLDNQERGLENLSNIIARQKNIAEAIHSEVDLHNDIIDDLGDHIDRTDVRIANETRNVTVIDRKDNTCVYWVVIVLLLISIIIVAAI
ncbi:syntaxin [Holotrichia oblita]|uniref:Syntaxin n=2 Tax=Holotrichia oblita TaxID=644536 RepID=A0ACB9TSR9_HOLOL|nr:syntaxin [Holotrichia oblita]